jgi:ribosomal protein L11 methyltransferase
LASWRIGELKTYPALTVQHPADSDLVAALVDDFSPTAIEPRDDHMRVFFTTPRDRDDAARALAPRFDVSAIEVSDEDWAARSQMNLQPITVGRITVVPNPESRIPGENGAVPFIRQHDPRERDTAPFSVVIRPSMGFGTGHHATTRLCLEALQTIDWRERDLLDIGTGSGILAIAGGRLGAARALGIDCDADAIQSARENLALNPEVRRVRFEVVDFTNTELPPADVVAANLTGALLVRSAASIAAAVRPAGMLMLSGVLAHERADVCSAFRGLAVEWEREEDGWVGLAVKKS